MKLPIKKHLLLFFSIVFLVSGTVAQELFLWQRDTVNDPWGSVLLTEGEVELGSNFLDNDYMSRLLFGGKIDNRQTEDALDNIRSSGSIGGEAHWRASYFIFKDSIFGNPDLGYTASFGEQRLAYAHLPKDAFSLVFKGNAAFAGQQADLNGLEFGYYAYNKLGFGLFNKKSWSYFRVNLLIGNQLAKGRLDGEFYTSNTGDTLSLDYSLDATYNLPDQRFLGGIGMGLEGALRMKLVDDKGWVQLAYRDLGFIFWDGATENYARTKTNYTFTGVDIPNLLDFDDDLSLPDFQDTLLSDVNQGSALIWLPPTVDASLWRTTASDHHYRLGMVLRPIRGYGAQLYASYIHTLTPNILINVDARYGGFRGFRMGAGVQTIFSGPRTWFGGIQVNDVPGLFLNNQQGRAVWISLGHIFKPKK